MKSILIIHLCQQEGEKVHSILERTGFRVVIAENSETALRKLYQTHPDTVIMADDSAEAQRLCSHIRDISNIPIIVLGDGGEIAQTMMLELGADFYLNQAVRPAELVARVHSLLRRYHRSDLRNPCLDPETNRVELEGQVVNLTPTEFRLFSCLVFNKGKVIPHSVLISDVWGGEVSRDTLHLYIRRLKQRLGIDSVGPYRLLKYRGEGYRFSGDETTLEMGKEVILSRN